MTKSSQRAMEWTVLASKCGHHGSSTLHHRRCRDRVGLLATQARRLAAQSWTLALVVPERNTCSPTPWL